MKISELRGLLKNKQVIEEINKHLWIESQKAGYSIGIERATDEWLRLYAAAWMKYNMPEKYQKASKRKSKTTKKAATKKKPAKKTTVTKATKKVKKTTTKKKTK